MKISAKDKNGYWKPVLHRKPWQKCVGDGRRGEKLWEIIPPVSCMVTSCHWTEIGDPGWDHLVESKVTFQSCLWPLLILLPCVSPFLPHTFSPPPAPQVGVEFPLIRKTQQCFCWPHLAIMQYARHYKQWQVSYSWGSLAEECPNIRIIPLLFVMQCV